MKAKIKPLIILIAIFAATLIAGVAAGCSIGEDTPQDVANSKGMYSSVTYYANGGRFSQSSLCYKTLYFEPGKPIYNINEDTAPVGSAQLTISRTNYEFAGWVKAELDENGKPTLLEMDELGETTGKVLEELDNGSVSIPEGNQEVNEQQKRFTAKLPADSAQWEYVFENGAHPTLQKDQHLYLVATWVPDVVLDYVLISDEPVTFSVPKADDPETEDVDESKEYEDVEFNSGDVIKSESFGVAGYRTLRPDNSPASPVSEHSYIYLFWDEECTKPATSANGRRVDRPQDGENAKIYAKYLPGKWTTVSSSLNVSSMFSSLASNYYLVDDIDCSTLSLPMNSGKFNGTILGNGYTLSNLNIGSSRSPVGPSNGATVSLFGELGESAVIKDLTIENVTAYVQIKGQDTGFYTVSAYALFSDFNQGATLENFSVNSYSLNISRLNENSIIGNIPFINEEYETTHWLYGGESDEDFINLFGNVITNAALTINDESIIGQEDSNE